MLETELNLTEIDRETIAQQAPNIAARLNKDFLPSEVKPVTFNFVVQQILNGQFATLDNRVRRIIDARVAHAKPLSALIKEADVTTRAGVSFIFRKGMLRLLQNLPPEVQTHLMEQRVLDIKVNTSHSEKTKIRIGEAAKERWSKEEFKKKVNKSQKRARKIRKIRTAKKRNWADPNYQIKMKAAKSTPEHKAKITQLKERDWQNPQYKQTMTQIKADWWRNPENEEDIENIREAMRQKWQDPEFSSRASKGWFKPKEVIALEQL